MSRWRRYLVSLWCCAGLLVTSAAPAQDVDDATRNAARNLAGQAKDSFERGDFERARDLFHRAYALVPAPTIALFEARTLVKLNRLVEADEAYMRAVRTSLEHDSPEAFKNAVSEAEVERVALRPRIPRVTVVVRGPGASHADLVLTVDGKVLPRALHGVEVPIDPGSHVLAGRVGSGEPVEVSFVLAERERQRVELTIPLSTGDSTTFKAKADRPAPAAAPSPRDQAAPAPTRSWQKPAAYLTGGVGVAGLVTGIVAGLVASSHHAKAEAECPDRACEDGSDGWEAVQSFRSLRTVSTIGYVVGGVGLAGGTTLFLTAPKTPAAPRASLRLWLSARAVGVGGAF